MRTRPVAALLLALAACREPQKAPVVAAPKPAAVPTQSAPPPAPDPSVPVVVTSCAENDVSFINVDVDSRQITRPDGQTVDRDIEVRGSRYEENAFMNALDASKEYVIEARLRGSAGRVERVVRCGASGLPLRVETAELTTDVPRPLVRVRVTGTGPGKVSYLDAAGAERDVALQVSVGSATGDVEGPLIHLAATPLGKLVQMTISADDPSGVASIQYTFDRLHAQPELYTEPLKFDPRIMGSGHVIAADKAGNRTEVTFSVQR